ncbi:MAG: FtsX-like permease family protein, partial [Bacteroidota bacterium]
CQLKRAGFEREEETYYIATDEHFLSTFRVELVAGRNFREGLDSIPREALLSLKAVEEYGFSGPSEALGQSLRWNDSLDLEVVGIVPNIQFGALTNPADMPAFALLPIQNYFSMIVMDAPGIPNESMEKQAETLWQELNQTRGFKGGFIENLIAPERMGFRLLSWIVGVVTFVGVVIACLGLLGMAVFATETRTKEIGIRKVLGAAVGQLVWLLSKRFILILGLATLFALPLAYLINQTWLMEVSYRMPWSWTPLIAGAGLLLGMGAFTIGSLIVRKAMGNPVEALRYE